MSRPVVSSQDVRDARRRNEHRLVVPPDAIVTPLAREEAARWGIELADEEPGKTPDHTATCDSVDDPIERIVDRVQARVPKADPEQVRAIARRVIEQMGR